MPKEVSDGTPHSNIPGQYPLLTVRVHFNNLKTPLRALIDSGASAPVIRPELAIKLG